MEPDELAELIRLANKFAEQAPGPFSELIRSMAEIAISNADHMSTISRRLERIERVLIGAAEAAQDTPEHEVTTTYRGFRVTDDNGISWTAVVRGDQPADVIQLGRALKRAVDAEQESTGPA